jgi:putative membrane protein
MKARTPEPPVGRRRHDEERSERQNSCVFRWFDPAQKNTVGTTPDYRFSLANERTFLAWIRTGLALIGGGLAVAAFIPPLRWPFVREGIAIALLLLGGAVCLRAVDHWARAERAMRLGRPLPPSRFPAVLALVIGAGAVLLLVLVVASGVRR